MVGEWSLVIFTLLAQAGIGLMVVAQLLGREDRSQVKTVLPWVGILVGISMLVSLGHLGSPLGAPRAILNLKSSWLSREIFFISGFMVLWLAAYLIEGKETVIAGIKSGLGWLTGIVGVLALVSMASIYANTMMPAWSNVYTHLSFYSTALVLGSILYAVLVYRSKREEQGSTLKSVAYLMALGVIVHTAVLAPYLVSLSSGVPAAQLSAQYLSGSAVALVLSQALAVLGGTLLIFRFVSNYDAQGAKLPVNGLYGILMVVLVAAVTSRYLFYASGIRILVGQF